MKKIAIPIVLILALMASLFVGCAKTPEGTTEAIELTFEVKLDIDDESQTVAVLGVHNTGEVDFAGDKNFGGVMEIRHGEGTPRARMDVLHLNQQLAPSEAVELERVYLVLAPGAYKLIWGAPAYGSTVLAFTIVKRDGKLTIGEQVSQVFDTYKPHYLHNEGEKVYPLMVGHGQWLEYEVISASNFTLGNPIQVGDRIRYEIVDTKIGQKMSLDGKIVLLHEAPICDLYVNGEKVADQVEQGILFPADVQFWHDYQAIEVNWEKESAKVGRVYKSEIRIESNRVLFEYSLDTTSWTRLSVDRETGIVLDFERVVDMQGKETSYHLVLIDSSVMTSQTLAERRT